MISPRAKIVISREFFLEGTEVRTDIFAQKHREATEALEFKNRATFWSDNSNLMLLNDLQALHNIAILPTEKEDKAEWLNLVRILLKDGRVEVDPSCKLLISTLNGAFWKDTKKKDYGRSKAASDRMDALDALIYFVRALNRSTNPFPVNYNIEVGQIYDSALHIYPADWNKHARTGEGRALERVFDKGRYRNTGQKPHIMGGL